MSLAVLLACGYAWASYRSLVSNVTNVDAIPARSAGQPSKDIDGTAQNILLVGDDDRTGATAAELQQMHTADDGGGVNTDTMMVLHVPADGSKATGISLPRDSWVDIPGFGMNKLNAAYELGAQNGGGAAGGAQLLTKVVENLTGLTINHYVSVSMLGFLRIANILGPIQVCLNEAAYDPYSGVDLPAGISTLNASQALAFVRQRHNLPRGDLDREVRQQYFLATEFRKLTQADTLLNPIKMQRLLSAVGSSIVKDPGLNLLQFAAQVQNLSDGNVSFATIPVTGTPDITANGQTVSIVALDYAAIPGFIDSVIGQPADYQDAKPVSPGTVSVDVVNGSGTAGAAARAAAALHRLGFVATADQTQFTTRSPDTSDITTRTTIEYPAGMAAAAKTLAGDVPGAQVAVSPSVSTVTLVLGADDLTVAESATASPTTGESASPTTGPTASPTAGTTSGATAGTTSQPARVYDASTCIN